MQPLESRLVSLVLGPKLLGLRVLADLGRGDVPPAAAAGQDAMFLDLGDDHARASFGAGLAQRLCELIGRRDMPGSGAEARGVCGQVDLEVLAFEAVGRADRGGGTRCRS